MAINIEDPLSGGRERRQMDPAVLAQRLTTMHEDLGEVKAALRDLTTAITKLALIEERQTQTTLALERAFTMLDRLEGRVMFIEQRTPFNDRTNMWVERVIWAAAVMGVLAITKIGGLS